MTDPGDERNSEAKSLSRASANTIERDAERYRWLRENWWNYGCGTERGYPMQTPIGGKQWWAVRDALSDVTSHAALDAAVDAAILADAHNAGVPVSIVSRATIR